MNSVKPRKTQWTWEEWQAGRQARRELSLRVGKPVCRRQESSADPRLRAAFGGERAPGLGGAKGEAGFTLGEVVAVLALLALLAAVLIPAAQTAVLLAQLDNCGEKARDVYVALSRVNTEREPSGKGPLPDGSFTNSTDLFRHLMEREPTSGLACKSLAGCGVPVCNDGKLKPENNMWTVIKEMRDEMEDVVPVMLTRNVDASSLSFGRAGPDRPLRLDPEWKTPLGDKGCVIIRKGGAIFRMRTKYLTNREVFRDASPNVGPVRYLTPSREVVAGE